MTSLPDNKLGMVQEFMEYVRDNLGYHTLVGAPAPVLSLEEILARDRETYKFLETKLEEMTTQLLLEASQTARLQAATDFAARLRQEFIKRELSSDKMPKGYRKMSNEELITLVWSHFAELKALGSSEL